MNVMIQIKRHFSERIGVLRNLQIIPLFLALMLVAGSAGSLGYIYWHGSDALLSASVGEKRGMSREITKTDDFENNVTVSEDYYCVELAPRFFSTDGKLLSGPEIKDLSRSVVVSEPYNSLIGYGLIGDQDKGKTRYLMDVYRGKIAENTYSPWSGIRQEKTPKPVEYVLSIDSGLQEAMYNYLVQNNVKGCIYCYDYESGNVLCMVSTPGCSSDAENQKDLESGTLLNKTIYTCPPGSNMKLVTLSLLASQGVDLSILKYTCSGSVELGDHQYTCTGHHGELDASGAIGKSCNCWFAQAIYNDLDIQKAAATLKSFGWTVNEETDDAVELRIDQVPVKRSGIHLKNRQDFSTVWSLIGETEVDVSPVWMTELAAELMAEKEVAAPHLILKGSDDQAGELNLYQDYFSAVSDVWKTGYAAEYQGYSEHITAAKTGTYEKENKRGGKDVSKTLVGVSEDLHVAFYISMENYRENGKQLSIVQRDVANELMGSVETLIPVEVTE